MSIRDDNAQAAIVRSMNVLCASERGRDVLADLYALLMGRASGLGGPEWSAVRQLLEVFQDGWPGSVLDALRPFELARRAAEQQAREDPLLRRLKEAMKAEK